MGLLTDNAIDNLKVDRIIFHVVGPDDSDLILMDEIDITGSEDFFLGRIRETNIGNRFNFIGLQQGVRPSLGVISTDSRKFVEISKELAQSFQNQHETVASKRGAFIIALLKGYVQPIFALVKFDDLKVLRFTQQTDENGLIKAIVSEINNTFQEDKKAMQKSALIVLNDDGGELAVYDKTNRKNITDYFKAFLGVKRLYTSEQASERFHRALKKAFNAHKSNAPSDVASSWRHKLHQATRDIEAVEPEKLDEFGITVFGSFWTNTEFRRTLDNELAREKISGEAIVVNKDEFPKPTIKSVKTKENITLRFPESLDGGAVKIEEHDDGTAVITITSQGITQNELVDQKTVEGFK